MKIGQCIARLIVSEISWIRVYVGYIVTVDIITVDIGRDLKVDLLYKILLDTRCIETFKTCLTIEINSKHVGM